MRTLIVTMIFAGMTGVATARLPEREAPRATDLLRARRLADQVEKRLELPRSKPSGWLPGGGGFGHGSTPGGGPDREGGDVRIEIHTPRPATRQR